MVSYDDNNWERERIKNEGTKKLSKNTLFQTFLCFFRLEGVCMVGKGVDGDVLMRQGQTGKIPCVSSEKITIFPHLAFFPSVPSKNLTLPPTSK